VNHHLVPGVGKHRLASLRPGHLERLCADILASTTKAGTPTKPATAHQVHRTARAALNEAVRRGHLGKNPALVARAPPVEQDEVEPFTVEEIQLIFKAASKVRNGARWELALGLRQGERLGLQWRDIDFATQTMAIRRSRLRPRYRHGCDGTCGRKYPSYCPNRVPDRPDTDATKSRAGRRYVGLPGPPRRTEPGAPARREHLDRSRLGLCDRDRRTHQPPHRLDALEGAPR
jgi:integrase